MRKVIKIFIASSIVEFANERMMIENFIRNVSDRFEEKYDIKIQPLLCENFDDAYSATRKQEEYNEKIRSSELCFFIFFTKAGKYTLEEFEVARKRFEETGKPKIYTYFKIIKDNSVEKSLTDFMDELDKTFGHFYGTFEHIDTIKLRILLSLKLQEMDFLEIKANEGECVVDGDTIMSLDNVTEFANNKSLEKLQDELSKVEEEFYRIKPMYELGNCDRSFYEHYCKIVSKRQILLDDINELQKKIFKISLQMSHDDIKGEISARQKEAYRLFELGDYEGCISVLDSKDIDDDFLKARERLHEQDIAICRKYIREHKTAIDILISMTDYASRFEEIENRYNKILPLIFEKNIEVATAYDYVCFLYFHQKLKIAYKIGKDLYEQLSIEESVMPKLLNLLGNICGERKKAIEYYTKAVEILENRKTSDFTQIAICYMNLSAQYEKECDFEKSCQCCIKANKLLISNKHKKITREQKLKVIDLHCSVGNFLWCVYLLRYNVEQQEIYDLSKQHYDLAIELQQNTESKSIEDSILFVRPYSCLSSMYYDMKDYKKSIIFRQKSIEMQKKVFALDPLRYIRTYIHDGLYAIAETYSKVGQYENSLNYMEQCISVIEPYIHIQNVELEDLLSEMYFGWAIILFSANMLNESFEKMEHAIKLYESLYSDNPEAFYSHLTAAYAQIVAICEEAKLHDEAQAFYDKLVLLRGN